MYNFNSIFNIKIFRHSFIFFLLISIFFLFPSDTYAQEIQSSGWYNGYKDIVSEKLGGPDNSSVGSPVTFNGGSISSSVEYVTLSPYYVTYQNINNVQYTYYNFNFISELSLFASAEFINGSYYTLNFEFNHGSYIGFDESIIKKYFNVYLYDGSNYTITPSSMNINVNYDSASFKGVISISFLATSNSNYVKCVLGDYTQRFNSVIAFNNSSEFENGFRVYLLSVERSDNLSDALLGQLAGQNQTIINQNQEIIEHSNKINEKLAESEETRKGIWETIKDFLFTANDDDTSGSQGFAKDFFNSFKDEDTSGLSDIVKAPLVMIESLISDSDESRCSNLNFEILGSSVYFPSGCSFWSIVPDSFRSLYHTIICGFFGYIIVISLFKDVQRLKNPNSSEVTTLDL